MFSYIVNCGEFLITTDLPIHFKDAISGPFY